jgi:hypothetical protein
MWRFSTPNCAGASELARSSAYHPNPVDLCAQSDLIGAPELMSIKVVLAAPIGSARSYLTLSTLATVLQSWDDRPHHELTTPLQHGSLSLREERWPRHQRCACDGSARLGESI